MSSIYVPTVVPPPIQVPRNGQLRTVQPSQITLGSDLARLGFSITPPPTAYRLIVCTVAPQKAGKTHWAFTAPDPISCLTTDAGTEEVAGKAMRGILMAGMRPKAVLLNRFKSAREMVEGEVGQKAQLAEWERWVQSYRAVLSHRQIRTLICDTGSEIWELCRLARLGKLTQVMPHHYGPVNAEFSCLVQEAFNRTDLNVIWIHKMKKEYKGTGKPDGKEGWTGRYERAGFADLPYQADINIQHYFDSIRRNPQTQQILPPAFGIQILDSRYQMVSLVGTRLEESMCTFEFLAESCFPDTMGTGFWR